MITLSTGRTLMLQELTQRLTYEGLLEGLPTSKANKSYLDRLLDEQRARQSRTPVFLLRPVETPIDFPSGRPYPFGSPAHLPGVTCIGRFRSDPIGQEDGPDCSELTIIWLQREFAMPIEPSASEEMARLDWDALAANFEH
jgi:hypothetical protein